MKGVLLQSILLSSLALVQASPVPSDPIELDIPLDNILSRNLSAFSSHPLFTKYEAWVSRNPNMHFLHGGDSIVKTEHPALNGVVCTESSQDCFLSSSVTIPGITPVGIRSPLTKRANAVTKSVFTHWKTYFEGQEGGQEHYTTWNLRCNTLEYKGTGFVLDSDNAKRYSDNDIATTVLVHEYRQPSRKITLQQNFGCYFLGNKCCGSYYIAKSTGTGKMTSWTWECTSVKDAPPCQG